MITFSYLDKSDKRNLLPILFDILYNNMKVIAPSDLGYEEEFAQWVSRVSPALERSARQVIVCHNGKNIVGFLQYYINRELLMIEEVQLERSYQRTMTFYRLCKYLKEMIPGNVQQIEAFAHRQNINSISLMNHLGMASIDDDGNSPFLHLRGCANAVKSKIR